jgi:hypothetical protein
MSDPLGSATSPSAPPTPRAFSWLGFAASILVLGIAHALTWQSSEPYFNNDETRHVMTGVFFHDLLRDLPLGHLRSYVVSYYLQYPALGLLVWPPLFHGALGAFMLVFGTSYAAARILLNLFCVLAFFWLFLLVRRTHGTVAAAVSVLLFGLSPMVFELSHHVMLEMPALAFALGAVYHFVLYLDVGRRRDIYLAAAAASAFALARYDGFFLLLFFGISLLGLRRFDVLRRRDAWFAAILAIVIVVPIYAPMLAEFGKTHLLVTAQQGPDGKGRHLLDALSFYPRNLGRSIGVPTALLGLVGLLAALRPERRRACWPYLALAGATYIAFTPLAELQARHSIYWVPAFALFAVEGSRWLAGRLRLAENRTNVAGVGVFGAIIAILVGFAFWRAVSGSVRYVRGYEAAARYVLANTHESRFTFIDGFLNGDFIYQIRRHDPEGRLWILRGDKLLYGVLNDPRGGYQEYAGGNGGDGAILNTLYRYDPELIVVENPQVGFEIPMAERLRQVLAGHPERFARVRSFPILTNVKTFAGARLDIYRSLLRNPNPEHRIAFGMMGLGHSLGVELPPVKKRS